MRGAPISPRRLATRSAACHCDSRPWSGRAGCGAGTPPTGPADGRGHDTDMEVPMTMGRWTACAVVLLGLGLGIARADVNGSYDGQISGAKVPTPVAAAAALFQNGKFLNGTVAVAGDPLTAFGGAYVVQGTATPKKVKAKGISPTGVKLKWTGKILGE